MRRFLLFLFLTLIPNLTFSQQWSDYYYIESIDKNKQADESSVAQWIKKNYCAYFDSRLSKLASKLFEFSKNDSNINYSDQIQYLNYWAKSSGVGYYPLTIQHTKIYYKNFSTLSNLINNSEINLPLVCGYFMDSKSNDESELFLISSPLGGTITPFPSQIEVNKSYPLCINSPDLWQKIDLYVGQPDGDVKIIPLKQNKNRYCTDIAFSKQGRYDLEIVGIKNSIPYILYLFPVYSSISPEKLPSIITCQKMRSLNDEKNNLFKLINTLRVDNNIQPLKLNDILEQMAQEQSKYLLTKSRLWHGWGKNSIVNKLLQKKVWSPQVAENLARVSCVAQVKKIWWDSPSHRLVMLSPQFTFTGIGISLNKNKEMLITQLLASSPIKILDNEDE